MAGDRRHSVVIIGGGLAGLYAARLLLPRFPDLLLVEASAALGGRIKQVEGVAEWPIEAGPEFVHGGNALLKGLLEEMGCQLRELAWPDHWWWRDERRLAGPGAQDAEVDWLEEKFSGIGAAAPPTPDVSAETWLRLQGASRRALAAADACWANDFGAGLAQLGVRELIAENNAWAAGESYLLLDRSLRELITHLAAPLAGRTRCGWSVSLVNWRPCSGSGVGGGAVLHGPHGQLLHCDRVLVTAPLRALQSGGIRFQPPLPPGKQAAMGRLRMGSAVKVLLGFSHPVWPEGFWDAICPGAFLPELWVTSYPGQQQPAAPNARRPAKHSRNAGAGVGGRISDSADDSSGGSSGAGSRRGTSEPRDSPGEAAAESPGFRDDARQAAAITVTAADVAAVQCRAPPQSSSSKASGGSLLSTGRAGSQSRTAVASPSGGGGGGGAAKPGGVQMHDLLCRHAVTGFVCGPAAEAIAALPAAVAVRRALAQLDDMFGTPQQRSPASDAFVTAAVVDWSRQPYIGGAYSYPTLGPRCNLPVGALSAGRVRALGMPLGSSPLPCGRLRSLSSDAAAGAEPGDRAALGAPVAGTLFFAGEATHPAVNPCMQAALETGQTAAAQIAVAASPPHSAL